MSIAQEIKRLEDAKAGIKDAIEEKGVTVGDGTISTYAEKIDEISGGGGEDPEYQGESSYTAQGSSYTLAEKESIFSGQFRATYGAMSEDAATFLAHMKANPEYMKVSINIGGKEFALSRSFSGGAYGFSPFVGYGYSNQRPGLYYEIDVNNYKLFENITVLPWLGSDSWVCDVYSFAVKDLQPWYTAQVNETIVGGLHPLMYYMTNLSSYYTGTPSIQGVDSTSIKFSSSVKTANYYGTEVTNTPDDITPIFYIVNQESMGGAIEALDYDSAKDGLRFFVLVKKSSGKSYSDVVSLIDTVFGAPILRNRGGYIEKTATTIYGETLTANTLGSYEYSYYGAKQTDTVQSGTLISAPKATSLWIGSLESYTRLSALPSRKMIKLSIMDPETYETIYSGKGLICVPDGVDLSKVGTLSNGMY